MPTVLQLVFLACVLVALVALTDWRWGLLAAGLLGFVSSVRWDGQRRRRRKAV